MTRVHSEAGRDCIGGSAPKPPEFSAFRPELVAFDRTIIEVLDRRIGLRRNATRAPTQAPEWRGRLWLPQISNQTRRSATYC